jgi:hypothetical protein
MPIRGPVFPALLAAALLLAAPQPAAATSQFWNGPASATTGAFESIAFAELQITGLSGFSFVDVSIAGNHLLEVFGQGSA